MPLTAAQEQKIVAWLKSKGVKPECPYCGRNDWSTGDVISGNVIDQNRDVVVGGTVAPMVQTICNNCGHVRLFAAAMMGLP